MTTVPTFITTPPQMSEDVFPSIEHDGDSSRSGSPVFPNSSPMHAAYSPPSNTYSSVDDQGFLTAPHPSYGYPVCTMGAAVGNYGLSPSISGGAMLSLPAMCGSPGIDAAALATTTAAVAATTTHAELTGGYYVPSIELMTGGYDGYDGYQATTPPLSHSFDHSATCSESEFTYPTTPLSMPSPGIIQ